MTFKQIAGWLLYLIIIAAIIVFWFFTTGASIKQVTEHAWEEEADLFDGVTRDFDEIGARLDTSLEQFDAQSKKLIEQASSSTTPDASETPAPHKTIDPAIIDRISQELQLHSTSTESYAEENRN